MMHDKQYRSDAYPIDPGAERSELDGLVRSTKTQYRLRQRARIVLLPSDGMAHGRLAGRLAARPARHRSGGCALCRAPACRARRDGQPRQRSRVYGRDGKRILAVLDEPPPEGLARWTGPLLATALGDVHDQYIWRFSGRRRSTSPGASRGAKATIPCSWRKRPRWSGLPRSPGERVGAGGRREAVDPSAGAPPGLSPSCRTGAR